MQALSIPTLSQIKNELARRHLADYVEQTTHLKLHEWQTEHVCRRLEKLKDERGARILIHGPPRLGKSIILTKRFPAWQLGHNPDRRIAICAYNTEHASSLTAVVRDTMRSHAHKQVFPDPKGFLVEPASNAEFFTADRLSKHDAEPSVYAIGLQTGFTGKGVDDLLIDDPYASGDTARSPAINEAVWRFWQETAIPRLTEETNVVVMFHRYHEDDLAGRLAASGKWEYWRFPAIADDNEEGDDRTGRQPGEILSPLRSLAFFEAIKNEDPQTFLSQFQGRPRPPEGAFIKREYLFTSTSGEPKVDRWVRYWDLATSTKQSADFTVGAMVGLDREFGLHLRDIVRFREEWPVAAEMIADQAKIDREWAKQNDTRVVYGAEKAGTQTAMIQDLFTKGMFQAEDATSGPAGRITLIPVVPVLDKKSRASGWVARARQGKFHMHNVRDWDSPAFIKECLGFTGDGTGHDDQVDAVSGAYELLWRSHGGKTEQPEPPKPGTFDYYAALEALTR